MIGYHHIWGRSAIGTVRLIILTKGISDSDSTSSFRGGKDECTNIALNMRTWPTIPHIGCEATVANSAVTSAIRYIKAVLIVLDSGSRTLRQIFEDQIAIRRAALDKKLRPLGFPTIVSLGEISDNPMKESLIAATFVAKYGSIIVLSDFCGESLFPLLVLRMNIYTDPQRPLATSEGIYEIGNPDENAPVLITSNFSLTYFIVSGEIENSRLPCYLLIKDTEGLSVMTAWAAGKFGADAIAPFVKKCGISERVKHKKLIIPGYIAVESGGLEEELPNWEILIGPREGAHIPAYLKNWKP